MTDPPQTIEQTHQSSQANGFALGIWIFRTMASRSVDCATCESSTAWEAVRQRIHASTA